MTATAQTQPYAIGPGFHDWDYEHWSALAAARDEALEDFTSNLKSELGVDLHCQSYKKIDQVMESIFETLYDDPNKIEKFSRLIFAAWYGLNGIEKINELVKMIDLEMNRFIESEFEKSIRNLH